MKWGLIEGSAECVGVELTQRDNARALTTAALRRLKLGEVVREAKRARYEERHGSVVEAYEAARYGAPENQSRLDSLSRNSSTQCDLRLGSTLSVVGGDRNCTVRTTTGASPARTPTLFMQATHQPWPL